MDAVLFTGQCLTSSRNAETPLRFAEPGKQRARRFWDGKDLNR